MTTAILILPGLFNSGEGHWQTLWERQLPNARRVQQRNWDSPDRSEWVATLDAAIQEAEAGVLLAAHSLGCALTAWWAAERGGTPHAAKVKGALLAAPPDVERDNFPSFATGFAPMPRNPLPFPAIVAASSNDPWCALPRAQSWAVQWRAQFHDIGPRGHINADSGLANWPQGHGWLAALAGG
ncbi:alpha/beta hydrolase [Noviherbaspirillum cavernae]|uniref:Alpha/beta hydrolase n=1 Tax=Noviherbaspirillum cavernae TaxID=2320862 RepID=A0A418X556_9BURK|nr:alpha/beta hydrolase [Noviherbaspirillum cavernae]RJG07613.1 alpha/beta hydrolase [Noviherbaspirillum cavernae]